jgi:hypothetical protein
MPSRQKAARIGQAEWESHREEMRTLYLLEDKSLRDVISHMENEYNFSATCVPNNHFPGSKDSWSYRKAQYERQFRSWEFCKNLSSVGWNFVNKRMEKRRRDGKESVLYLYGSEIPHKRIKKEISRHCRPTIVAPGQICIIPSHPPHPART